MNDFPKAPAPAAAPPSRGLIVPLAPAADGHRQQDQLGYLDRNPDSGRPLIRAAPSLRTADMETRVAHAPVAAAARHLLTQSGFLSYGVELNACWMVGGDGLGLNVSPDADALGWRDAFAATWARALERRFAEWSNDQRACDGQGRQKFSGMQSSAVRSYLSTGDILALLDYGQKPGTAWRTSIGMLDPSRLKTPHVWQSHDSAVRDGIEFDRRGRALGYHFRPANGYGPTVRVPAWQGGKQIVCHTFDGDVGTIRGISPLGAAIGGITQAMNIHDAAVLAAHIAATVVGVVTSDLPSADVARSIGGPDGGNVLASMMEQRVGWHELLKKHGAHLQIGHGRIAHLSTGEKFDLFAGKVGFDQHEKMIRIGFAEAARALGLSPEFLHGLKDDASYSSLKWAAVEARAIMERRRKILIEPLNEFALWAVAEELIDTGELPWPGVPPRMRLDDFRVKRQHIKLEWRGPQIADPDELKSARAAIERVRWGLSSLTDEISATGRDAEATFRQRQADEKMLTGLGVSLPWPTEPEGTTP